MPLGGLIPYDDELGGLLQGQLGNQAPVGAMPGGQPAQNNPMPAPQGQAPIPQAQIDENRLTVDNPQDPQVFEGLKNEWKGWMDRIKNDENFQLSILKMGLNMMQPVQPGQSLAGHLAQSANVGIDTLRALKAQDVELEGRKAQTEQTKKETGQMDEKLELAKERSATYAKQVGLQERQMNQLLDPESTGSQMDEAELRRIQLQNDVLANEIAKMGRNEFEGKSPNELQGLFIAKRVKEFQDTNGMSYTEAYKSTLDEVIEMEQRAKDKESYAAALQDRLVSETIRSASDQNMMARLSGEEGTSILDPIQKLVSDPSFQNLAPERQEEIKAVAERLSQSNSGAGKGVTKPVSILSRAKGEDGKPLTNPQPGDIIVHPNGTKGKILSIDANNVTFEPVD